MAYKDSTANDIGSSYGVENSAILDDKDSAFKRGLLFRIIAIASAITALFASLDAFGLHQVGSIQRNFNFVFSFANFILAILLYKKLINFLITCNLFLFFCYIGCIVSVVQVTSDEFRAIWFFLTIFYAFMLVGVFIGYLLTSASVVALVCIQIFATQTYNDLSLATILIALGFYSLSLAAFSKQMDKHRKQLRKQSIELHYLANKDPLTDVLNSKNHYILGKSLLERAKNTHSDLSMLCVFIDNLEMIYQKYGLQIEANLLSHVEKLMNAQLYDKGDIAKVSQKEFCILLPDSDILSAKTLAKKINQAVQDNLFATGGNKIPLTLSIGISTLLENDNEIRSIQVRADKALTKAKSLGGNKTITDIVESTDLVEDT